MMGNEKQYASTFANLIDDGDICTYETGKDDIMCLPDPTLPMFLNITVHDWAELVTDHTTVNTGVAYRLLPFNGRQVGFLIPEGDPKEIKEQGEKLLEELQHICQQNSWLVNDLDMGEWEKELQNEVCENIPEIKELLNRTDSQQEDDDTILKLLPKMAIQAKKIACILSFMDNYSKYSVDFSNPPCLTARAYFKTAFELVAKLHIYNMEYIPATHEESINISKLMSHLRGTTDKKKMTVAGITRYCYLKQPKKENKSRYAYVAFMLKVLEVSGMARSDGTYWRAI